MSDFTQQNVTRSLFKWFSDNYDETAADAGVARLIDTKTLNDWVQLLEPSVTEAPVRRIGKRCYAVVVTVRCYGKSRTNIYKSLATAQAVIDLFRQENIPIVSFDESGTPTIGYLKCEEPDMSDDTEIQGDNLMDVRIVSIMGYAEEL